MIFLVLGTQLPFDRLVRAMDDWCAAGEGREVFGQLAEMGPDNYRPERFEWVEKLPPEAFKARFEAAEIVVAHAGMGAIITALTLGKPLVIMPRRADLKEHRNDHQLATAARFDGRGGVHAVDDPADLHAALDRLRAGSGAAAGAERASDFAEAGFTDALRGFILGGGLPDPDR